MAVFLVLSGSSFAHGQQPAEFRSGLWFDGRDFRPGTFYSVNGILTRSRPAAVDQTRHVFGRSHESLQHAHILEPRAAHGMDGRDSALRLSQ
jgi:hypothetical protein